MWYQLNSELSDLYEKICLFLVWPLTFFVISWVICFQWLFQGPWGPYQNSEMTFLNFWIIFQWYMTLWEWFFGGLGLKIILLFFKKIKHEKVAGHTSKVLTPIIFNCRGGLLFKTFWPNALFGQTLWCHGSNFQVWYKF